MLNTATDFGWLSRLIHWLMAAGLIGMLVLGTLIADMEVSLANLWLYGLHKTVGLTLLALVLARLVWHRISPPPKPLPGPAWQATAARWTHRLFYLLLLAIPLTGWIASSATGLDVLFADRWVIPPIAPVSEAWETAAFALHAILTNVLIGLVALHVAAALKHAWTGDGTLRRMLLGRAERS